MSFVNLDEDAMYEACKSRDSRFDGYFFMGVSSTGIYCRPSCPALTPKRSNASFFSSRAAAESAGFRACRRCRSDLTPGSPEWNVRSDLASRAMALINDGLVDRSGITGLASALAVSPRHLQRILVSELGASPLALSRSRRAHTARILIESTALPLTEVAFGAGFASVRQFNETIRAVFGTTPSELRRACVATSHTHSSPSSPQGFELTPITVRLAAREPFAGTEIQQFLAARAIDGVESVDNAGTYNRVLTLPHGPALMSATALESSVEVRFQLTEIKDLSAAVARCRRLFDLDADPVAIDAALSSDQELRPLVEATPGRRSPGAVNGTEMAVRAIVGQQISVAGARTVIGRMVSRLGVALPGHLAVDGLTAQFPSPEALADSDSGELSMPRSRATALIEVAALIASGDVCLDAGADRIETEQQLLRVKGIGPWTTAYLSMRALGDPDVFLATDLGVLKGLERLGVAGRDPKAALARSEQWKPWRSYALHHLWSIPSPG